jgi:hypothetical protein
VDSEKLDMRKKEESLSEYVRALLSLRVYASLLIWAGARCYSCWRTCTDLGPRCKSLIWRNNENSTNSKCAPTVNKIFLPRGWRVSFLPVSLRAVILTSHEAWPRRVGCCWLGFVFLSLFLPIYLIFISYYYLGRLYICTI